jgi:protein tyrosine/serine phosphatase
MSQGTRRLIVVFVVLALVAGIVAWVLLHRHMYVGYFAPVQAGVLYRCRQARGVQWEMLDRHGITTVVNLRTRSEYEEHEPDFAAQAEELQRRGVRLVHIPVSDLLPDYEHFEQFLRAVRESDEAAVVHCAHGRNRTGFMAAAWRVVMQDWPVERALEELESFNAEQKGEKRQRLEEMLRTLHENRHQWRQKTDPRRAGTAPAPQREQAGETPATRPA